MCVLAMPPSEKKIQEKFFKKDVENRHPEYIYIYRRMSKEVDPMWK